MITTLILSVDITVVCCENKTVVLRKGSRRRRIKLERVNSVPHDHRAGRDVNCSSTLPELRGEEDESENRRWARTKRGDGDYCKLEFTLTEIVGPRMTPERSEGMSLSVSVSVSLALKLPT